MEEHVGKIWHRFITRTAATGYPQARVELTEVSKTVGILFRASNKVDGFFSKSLTLNINHYLD